VEETLFAAMDRMIEAGGQKIGKAAVTGDLKGKPASNLIEDLQKRGYVRKDGSKFTLTDEGRRAWEGQASEERKREVADRPIAAFLAVVQKQGGKALTAKQQQPFGEGLIHRVQADGLVIEEGANKYRLSPKGEEFLQAREPIESQLARLRTNVQELLKAPQRLLERLARDSEKLSDGAEVRSAFAEARSTIHQEVARSQAEFERSLEGLQAFAGLIEAGQAFKKALPAAVSGVLARIDAEAGRVQKLETELRQTADQIREQLEQARQEMERRAAAVEEKVRGEKKPAAAAGSTPVPSSTSATAPASDEAVWQATRRAYEQMEQQFKMTSELIKVPNLTDLVRKEISTLTPTQFHDLLQRWQGEDRLVLQVCNDPHFEPRSVEGIPSSRGLLFYVEMK
jgi:predicted transcriptional regulator